MPIHEANSAPHFEDKITGHCFTDCQTVDSDSLRSRTLIRMHCGQMLKAPLFFSAYADKIDERNVTSSIPEAGFEKVSMVSFLLG